MLWIDFKRYQKIYGTEMENNICLYCILDVQTHICKLCHRSTFNISYLLEILLSSWQVYFNLNLLMNPRMNGVCFPSDICPAVPRTDSRGRPRPLQGQKLPWMDSAEEGSNEWRGEGSNYRAVY